MPDRNESLTARLHDALRSKQLCSALLARLESLLAGQTLRFMEVCGTHTVAIFQSGLRSLLPPGVKHLSGPGCPVCVTHESEVALLLDLAGRPGTIIATFGDLLRVPGPSGQSLKTARAAGARIEIVYSPLDALKIAVANPDSQVVFPGIGFETTVPAVAAALISARTQNIANFSVLSLHKLVPPALRALLAENDGGIDAFLLPGHVATVTGPAPFEFLPLQYRKPAAIGGFEPVDILLALCSLAEQKAAGRPEVANVYPRAVNPDGNPKARQMMELAFRQADALWRGLGKIGNSGLEIRAEFASFDARKKFDLQLPQTRPLPGCMCGSILKGLLEPPQCPLFAKKCTPAQPVGPCMVSTEGSCAAYYKYGISQ